MPLRVQYGCGWSAPIGWWNFDASPTLRFERIPFIGRLYTRNTDRFPGNVKFGDIVQGLPLPDQSCELLYCSHVLEHLTFADCQTAISNSYRLLSPDGIWRMVLPDLRSLAEEYIHSPRPTAAHTFMKESGLGAHHTRSGVLNRGREAIGNSRHQWLWDFDSLHLALTEAGFADVRRAEFGDSGLSAFAHVEDPVRWAGALGVQCRRPA